MAEMGFLSSDVTDGENVGAGTVALVYRVALELQAANARTQKQHITRPVAQQFQANAKAGLQSNRRLRRVSSYEDHWMRECFPQANARTVVRAMNLYHLPR